jgi:hypothetical protein
MQRIKRLITVTAITAMTAGSVPAIAAAATNTGLSSEGATSFLRTTPQGRPGLDLAASILQGYPTDKPRP